MSSLAKKLGVYDYKKTNLNWLPYIPNHWELKRLKEVSKSMGSGATPMTNIDGYYENGILNWVNTGDLNDGIIDECKYKISQLAINNYPNLKIYKPGTLLIAMYGATIGKIGLLNISATTNQACCCITLNNYNYNKYYFYCFIAFKEYLISLSVGGTQPNVGQGIISKIILCSPPLTEQTQIANYLDTKTQAIDKKINLLTTKIEYYKELRKTIINNAVTKGLDKNVKLKESGIEWIGKIPEHWEVKRLKEIAKTVKGKNLDFFDEPFENSLPNLSLDYLRNDETTFINYCYTNDKTQLADENDFIIIWDGAGIGEILRAKKGFISSTTAKFIFDKKFSSKFFFHLRDNIEYTIKQIPTGMGIPHLNPQVLNNYPCPFPPKQEQTEIAQYLDAKTNTIDKITINLQTQIETLKELRKTLINDVVTGKVKVTK